MSVRRLAAAEVQPGGFAFSAENSAWADATVRKYPPGRQQSAVIPLLMRAQEQDGWVTRAAIETIADMLEMPYIRALEVATFYTQFQLKPVGSRAHIQVCGTTPCMLRGSEELMAVCRSRIHHDQFHLNVSGTLSWEEVECLGACVNAPMVMIFKDTYEDLTPERLGEIIDQFDRGEGGSVPVGPQNGRLVSAPATGLTSLTDEAVLIDAVNQRSSRPQSTATAETVPPSKAARPATDAIETSPAVQSPSPVKVAPAVEGARESEAPPHDGAAADKGHPAVEDGEKDRERPIRAAEPEAGNKAPELQRETHVDDADAVSPSRDGGGAGIEPPGATESGQSAATAGSAPSSAAAPPTGQNAASAAPEASAQPPAAALDHPDRPRAVERPETVDNLKLVSGIGPKIEGILHGLGIFTFGQIAAWTPAERQWVDRYLNFHGRIERDDWQRQADALARGGVAEGI